MSPKCRYVNATSTQGLPACLRDVLRALLARRSLAVPSLFFFNIADRLCFLGALGGHKSSTFKVDEGPVLVDKVEVRTKRPR